MKYKRWLTLLYKVTTLLTALVWVASRDRSAGALLVLLLLAVSLPIPTRHLRRNEHPATLGAVLLVLAIVLLLNRAWL